MHCAYNNHINLFTHLFACSMCLCVCAQSALVMQLTFAVQSWKPSSGSLATDSDTVAGWLAVHYTPGGDHQSG